MGNEPLGNEDLIEYARCTEASQRYCHFKYYQATLLIQMLEFSRCSGARCEMAQERLQKTLREFKLRIFFRHLLCRSQQRQTSSRLFEDKSIRRWPPAIDQHLISSCRIFVAVWRKPLFSSYNELC